jgi:hypothetical protein
MSKTNVYITETRKYKCEYCRIKYIPNRRRVQKYCSASCRSKAFYRRKNSIKNLPSTKNDKGLKGFNTEDQNSKTKINKMSLAGAGNAAAGALAVNLITNALTPEEKKAATKGDLSRLENKLKRYHRVINFQPRADGSVAIFDMESKHIIYSQLKHLT